MKKNKSPFLKDKPSGTLPKNERSLYQAELLQRADAAIKKVKKALLND